MFYPRRALPPPEEVDLQKKKLGEDLIDTFPSISQLGTDYSEVGLTTKGQAIFGRDVRTPTARASSGRIALTD
jgi:hypothetical protein